MKFFGTPSMALILSLGFVSCNTLEIMISDSLPNVSIKNIDRPVKVIERDIQSTETTDGEVLRVCVDSFLRGYPNSDFNINEAFPLYRNDEVTKLETAATVNPANNIEMVEVIYDTQNLWVASAFLAESCDEDRIVHDHNHDTPSNEEINAHSTDRSRPHSLSENIAGIKGNLIRPMQECRPCGIYKLRRTSSGKTYFHPGTDLCSDQKGIPTYAIYTGVVVETTTHCEDDFHQGKGWNRPGLNCKNSRGFGNRVMLMHKTDGKIWYSGYHHLGQVHVQKGDLVAPGQMLGTVGSTGVSFNYHLHFEIMEGPDSRSRHVRNDPEHYYENGKVCDDYFYQRRN